MLNDVTIISTKVEPVTERHQTPWLKQWTLHTVEISEDSADTIAEKISHSLDTRHSGSWYADFKNDRHHFIFFKDKVFKVDRSRREQYEEVVKYGTKLGIPKHQLDFSPDIQEWER